MNKKKIMLAAVLCSVVVIAGFAVAAMQTLDASAKDLLNSESETVIFFDDFDANTVKWKGVGSGQVCRSEVMAFSGDASLNVTAQAWSIEEALRQVGPPDYPLSPVKLSFWFSMPMTPVGYFIFGLEYCSARRDTWYRSGIQFISGEYENDTGGWSSIEGYPCYAWDISDGYEVWHSVTLTIDLAAGYYLNMTVDDYVFDLENLGYKCYDRTLESDPVLWGVLYPYFYAGSNNSSAISVLIEDVSLSVLS